MKTLHFPNDVHKALMMFKLENDCATSADAIMLLIKNQKKKVK